MESSLENGDSYKGMSADNITGLILAISSSFFIGASFIVKKKGLKKAGATGIRAGIDLSRFQFLCWGQVTSAEDLLQHTYSLILNSFGVLV